MSTFSQIYIQIVFAVKGRESLIHSHCETEVYKYITGIIRNKDQKLIAINGMPDHVHILIGMNPSCVLSDLVREIKKSSNDFINEKSFATGHFGWQAGYGAFSYNHSDLTRVINYIENQKTHHAVKSFRDEYIELLNEFEIDFKSEYLYEWID